MTRILITGAGGFVGKHLIRQLQSSQPSASLYGIVLNKVDNPEIGGVEMLAADLLDSQRVHEVMETVKPDAIYHLAAQSSPRLSFQIPAETLQNNLLSQLNLFQSCLTLNIKPNILIVGSADAYGMVKPESLPVTEQTPFRPSNPYAVSKAAQDLLGLQYFLSHKLPILRARPFNHIGPGQRQGFVATDFASQVARIEVGLQEPILTVGNLTAKRDFTDVRDVVRAYDLLMQFGTPGEAYNICTGHSHSIQYLMETLIKLSRVPIEVRVDQARMLPADIPDIRGDSTQLRQATGWEPTIPFERSLNDILDDWRKQT
ncbi:MAG TPA: GDP-mannose 4,6-dehydratase [Aggregatilineales bacterium]|nr:GDP-mannose 4,6-dehydratase [Anaerolineae bacterium]HUN05455.1 GDP-mannose 4,6-dehydratase [Aggregatilineales bacterium]